MTKHPQAPIHLTSSDRDIAALVVDGFSNRQIAARLRIAEQTVRNRLSRLYAKLGVATRVGLAVFAVRHGWDQTGRGG